MWQGNRTKTAEELSELLQLHGGARLRTLSALKRLNKDERRDGAGQRSSEDSLDQHARVTPGLHRSFPGKRRIA
jgi:hypothetical protein